MTDKKNHSHVNEETSRQLASKVKGAITTPGDHSLNLSGLRESVKDETLLKRLKERRAAFLLVTCAECRDRIASAIGDEFYVEFAEDIMRMHSEVFEKGKILVELNDLKINDPNEIEKLRQANDITDKYLGAEIDSAVINEVLALSAAKEVQTGEPELESADLVKLLDSEKIAGLLTEDFAELDFQYFLDMLKGIRSGYFEVLGEDEFLERLNE